MRKPEQLITRSLSMLIVAYYLFRCGQQAAGKKSEPPRALGVKTWKEAYELFYDVMGDGRTPSQFRNSIKNARDTFDILFKNGRIGWVDKKGGQPSQSARFRLVHEEWKNRKDRELEEFVIGIHATAQIPGINPVRVRKAGGEKVYVSVRRERDPKLRADAIALHGLDCMACGFNFEDLYGKAGKDFIEVHHIVPLSESDRTETNPETDLIVLCANCHRIVHRRRNICLSLDELKEHIGP